MSNRINVAKAVPEAYKSLMSFSLLTQGMPITSTHKHLIKIRSSQINSCAFCINMHTVDARKDGETEQRIYLLNAWREVKGLYTDEERAVLAFTEEVTLINQHAVSDATYNELTKYFDEAYIGALLMAIVTINAWNRIAITTELQPA
ncbi:MAG TPA: carboxymuconolactone decarboxylase family protein [Flavipsychrobacter sp.]